MVPPAVIASEPRFLNQQNPFYGYVNPQGTMMSMPPFAAFNNPYMNAAAFNQQNMMAWTPPRPGTGGAKHRGANKTNPNQTHPTVPTPMSPLVQQQHQASNEQRPLSEKESKELKRKKANRESARRSKLRKKEEFENLFKQVSLLQAKGVSLRTEIAKMEGVLETLSSHNQSLKRELEIQNGSSKGNNKKSKLEDTLDDTNVGGLVGLSDDVVITASENDGEKHQQRVKSLKDTAEGQQESVSTDTSEGSDGTNDIQELEQ
jgi:hypothetical protein